MIMPSIQFFVSLSACMSESMFKMAEFVTECLLNINYIIIFVYRSTFSVQWSQLSDYYLLLVAVCTVLVALFWPESCGCFLWYCCDWLCCLSDRNCISYVVHRKSDPHILDCFWTVILRDTIQDAILTCCRKQTRVSLICLGVSLAN